MSYWPVPQKLLLLVFPASQSCPFLLCACVSAWFSTLPTVTQCVGWDSVFLSQPIFSCLCHAISLCVLFPFPQALAITQYTMYLSLWPLFWGAGFKTGFLYISLAVLELAL